MLALSLPSREEGVHTMTLHPDPEELDLDPNEFSDIAVSFRLDVHPRRVLVLLDAEATAALICDRTLVPFREQVSGSHALLFTSSARPEDEREYDDIHPLPETDSLDVTAAVRDTLLLALPLRRVAPEAREIDLPVQFGAAEADDEPPIDPRWEALRALRNRDDEGE